MASTSIPTEPEAGAYARAQPHGVDHGSLEQFLLFARRYIMVGDPARPFEPEPFQRKALADYFNGVPETLILLPKGNGKSTLVAAVALYHLVVVTDADVKIVASSRPAAEQIFEFAQAMVAKSPALSKLLKVTPSTREMRTRKGLGRLKALPAEVKSIDGKAPTLVLADELHHWDKPEVYAMLAGGLFKRGGRLIGISTAGADLDSFLGRMRQRIREHIVSVEGAYTYARTPDGAFALHEWKLRDGARYDDFEAVKEANPLASITIETLRQKFHSPSTVTNLWCRLHCNLWVQDALALIDREEWDDLERPGCRVPDDCETVIVNCDFGWRKDTTAIIPLGVISQSPLILRVDERLRIIPAPGDGTSTKPATIKRVLKEMHGVWGDRMVIALDPNAEGHLIAEWAELELGVTVIIQPQDPTPMAHAASLTSELVRDGRLEHPGHGEFTRQVCNAPGVSVSKAGDKVRFGKHGTVPNDAAIALAIGVRQAHVLEPDDGPEIPVFY